MAFSKGLKGKPSIFWLSFLIAFALLYCAAMPLMDDADAPWHLAAGHYLLASHHLPATDPWAYTAAGQPWYLLSWLWDAAIAALESAIGLHAVYCAMTLLAAFLVCLLTHNAVARGAGPDAVLLTVLLAALCLLEFTSARPQLAGYACLLFFHRLLHASRGEHHCKSLMRLPWLMCLWSNLHGSFLIGFGLLGAYGLEALIARNRAWALRLFLIALACLAATLLNPYGLGLYTGSWRTLHSVVTSYIDEWRPFVFGRSIGVSAWLMVFLFAAFPHRRFLPLADTLLAYGSLLMMLFSFRNASLFVLLSAPSLAVSLHGARARLRVRDDRLADFLAHHRTPHVLVGLSAMAIVAALSYSLLLKPGRQIASPEHDLAGLAHYLAEQHPPLRLLNDYASGGQLLYYGHGRIAPFIDSRAGTAYSETTLRDYIELLRSPAKWQEMQNKYRFEAIVLTTHSSLADAFATNTVYRRQWRLAYQDPAASLYLRAAQD